MHKITFYCLSFAVVLISACTRLPNIQGNGSVELQGIWNQDSIPNQQKLLSYTLHNFKFTCDSFYVSFNTHAQVKYYADSCYNNGNYQEFAKGTYIVKDDTLSLRGTFTKANFKQKVSGCFNIGQYLNAFVIREIGPEKLKIENLGNHQISELVLVQPIVCSPKPL